MKSHDEINTHHTLLMVPIHTFHDPHTVVVWGDVFQFCSSFPFDPSLVSCKLQFFKLGYIRIADVGILPSRFFLLISTLLQTMPLPILFIQSRFIPLPPHSTSKIELGTKWTPSLKSTPQWPQWLLSTDLNVINTHITWKRVGTVVLLSVHSVLVCELIYIQYDVFLCCVVLLVLQGVPYFK